MLEELEKMQVALHPEGVDRNVNRKEGKTWLKVALHPEGVDRNSIIY